MIYDRLECLTRYDGLVPGAIPLARCLESAGFDPDDPQTHGGFAIRHKAYATRDDGARLFEVHHHTIDLMICRAGSEIIHITDPAALAPGAPLPAGQDGEKRAGPPQGSAILLTAGHFIAILPGEAHMVAGHPAGTASPVEKLVVKLPARDAQEGCPCQSDCVRHGSCALCVRWHQHPTNSLPACLREKGKAMIQRALAE